MAETSFNKAEQRPPGADIRSPEGDRPNVPPPGTDAPEGSGQLSSVSSTDEINVTWWERALADAERAEKDFRTRGREIVQIYRGDLPITRPKSGKYVRSASSTQSASNFNILYANTEVMLPAAYAKPPAPVVRSRFTKKSAMPQPMMGALSPGMGPPGMAPPGMPPPPGAESPDGTIMGPPVPIGGGQPPAVPPMSGGPPPPPQPGVMSSPATPGALPPPNPAGGGAPGPSPLPPPGSPPGAVPSAPPGAPVPAGPAGPQMGPPGPPVGPGTVPQPGPMPPGMPAQQDIETAASVMEKALEIVVDDEASHEAIRNAVKDMLLPGRGVCRVRWKPILKKIPVEDPVMGGPLMNPATGEPQMRDQKIWETVDDEYVFWEDILLDPVRSYTDVGWIAFRHLFDEQSLMQEFGENEQLQKLYTGKKLGELLKWTEESAAKSPVGGGASPKSAGKLDAVIRKAMVWEIWNRSTREVIWLIRELGGMALRVDPDTLGLQGFYPIPKPITAVTSTDTTIPKAFFDLYAKLAEDLDATSARISDLTEKIKVRGGYNSANKDIAELLKADDGKLLPVDGVDMLSGGLQNHIWLVPILEWVNALKELYASREQQKNAIYEIIGIADIVRGATNPYETATAQRIKGTMGTGRMQGARSGVANFVRDLMRLKADIIARNFDAETLTMMTGEDVTPTVMDILRSDFLRVCSIDIETDSTVDVDETSEKEANAQIMQVIGGSLTAAQGLLQTGILPPPMIIQLTLEMIKMLLHPVRHSRGVIELIDDYQEMLGAYMKMDPTGAMMRPPPPPVPAQPPPRGANGKAPPQPQASPPGASPGPSQFTGPPVGLQ